MLPVIEVPSFIRNFISSFNLSYHSRKHMARYVTGLIASFNKTIKGINSIFLDKPSDKALNRFLSEYQWNERKVNKQRLEELQKHNETRWSKYGILNR